MDGEGSGLGGKAGGPSQNRLVLRPGVTQQTARTSPGKQRGIWNIWSWRKEMGESHAQKCRSWQEGHQGREWWGGLAGVTHLAVQP